MSNGKLITSIDTCLSYIYGLDYKNDICSIIGISENEGTTDIVFKGFGFETKVF